MCSHARPPSVRKQWWFSDFWIVKGGLSGVGWCCGRGKREEGRGKREGCLNRLCALSSGARYVLDESSLTCSSDSLTHPLTHSLNSNMFVRINCLAMYLVNLLPTNNHAILTCCERYLSGQYHHHNRIQSVTADEKTMRKRGFV